MAMDGAKYPGLSGLKKLAIFCYTILDTKIYEVYVVDVNLDKIRESFLKKKDKISESSSSDSKKEDKIPESSGSDSDYIDIYPAIRFEGLNQWGACVFDSSLYIFEGDQNTFDTDQYPPHTLGKSVKKFNLLSAEVLNPEFPIGIEKFDEVCAMNHPKQNPIAVVTPDGKKILVFSSSIGTYPKYPPPFELYDPELNTWVVLEASGFGKRFYYTHVVSYTFIDPLTFMLETKHGVFFLDLNPSFGSTVAIAKDYLWRSFTSWDYCNLITINRRVLLTPRMVIELVGHEEHKYKLSPLPVPIITELDYREPPRSITLLGYEDEDEDEDTDKEAACYTLVSQTQTRSAREGLLSERRSSLLIDVCHTDLYNFNTSVLGTLHYVINGGAGLLSLQMFII